MKVLFASVPADGHFYPLTRIAVGLRDRGHEIGWYAGPRYAAKVESLGLPVHPYRRATEVMAEEINDLYPERAKLRGPKRLSFDVEKFFIANVEHNFLDIRDLRQSFPFDILLCDGAFYAERLVHHALGVPVMAVALSTVLPSPEGPPPFFGLRPARNPLDRLVHSVVRKMVASTNKAAVTAYNAVLARYGVPPISADGFPDQPVRELTRIFLNASPGLEFPSYRPPAGAEWVGPLLPARRDSARRPYNLPGNITDAKRKVVAVSQGTVDKTHTSKLIEPRLAALRDGPYVVVATTGGSRTEELRTRYSAPNVVIEDFIDYDVLFPHVDLFVTNGGYGSILEAMCHGVPVVSAGTREGKNDNNARIQHNRLGIDLRTERPKARQVAAAVTKALTDPAIRRKVDRLRDELASYEPVTIIERALLDLASAPPRGGRGVGVT